MHNVKGTLVGMSLSSTIRKVLGLIVAIWALGVVSKTAAVTAPYQDNFDSYAHGTQPANFVTAFNPGPPQSSGFWQVYNPKGRGAFQGGLSGYQANISAAVSVTNVDSVGFFLATTFTIRSRHIGSGFSIEYIGVGALSNGPDFATNGYLLFYDIHDGHPGYEGTLSITAGGGPNHGHYIAHTWVSMPFTDGTTYTITLQGTYSVNGLTLTGTLSNGRKILSVSGTDNFPQHGTYFGYYSHVDGDYNHYSSQTVDFDNFTISLPGFTTDR